jgi:hypothetical protein
MHSPGRSSCWILPGADEANPRWLLSDTLQPTEFQIEGRIARCRRCQQTRIDRCSRETAAGAETAVTTFAHQHRFVEFLRCDS